MNYLVNLILHFVFSFAVGVFPRPIDPILCDRNSVPYCSSRGRSSGFPSLAQQDCLCVPPTQKELHQPAKWNTASASEKTQTKTQRSKGGKPCLNIPGASLAVCSAAVTGVLLHLAGVHGHQGGPAPASPSQQSSPVSADCGAERRPVRPAGGAQRPGPTCPVVGSGAEVAAPPRLSGNWIQAAARLRSAAGWCSHIRCLLASCPTDRGLPENTPPLARAPLSHKTGARRGHFRPASLHRHPTRRLDLTPPIQPPHSVVLICVFCPKVLFFCRNPGAQKEKEETTIRRPDSLCGLPPLWTLGSHSATDTFLRPGRY
jgi:hypothetical protein